MEIGEQTARRMFGPEMPVPGELGYKLWAMQVRQEAFGSFKLNPTLALAIAANGGRYIACAQNR
jgi:hypothetical protein